MVFVMRSALAKTLKFKIRDPAKDEKRVPWQPLGSFDQTAQWGEMRTYIRL